MEIPSKRLIQLFLLLGVWTLLAVISCSKDDPTSPPPDVPPEGETEQIDNEGGTVALGDATITVPAGYLPEPLPFTLTKKKSFTLDATYTLDPVAYQPMGVAFQFDTPLRSSVPLTLTIYFKTEDVPTGFDAANLGVVQRVTSYPEALAGNERSLPQPEVHYLPLPTVVSPESGTVTFELFGSGTYQLLAMSEPIDTYPFAKGDVKSDGVMRAEEIDFKIHHSKRPEMNIRQFDGIVGEAIRAAHAKYQSLGFTLPEGKLRIVTVKFRDPTDAGAVAPDNHLRMELAYDLEDADEICRVVSHEYFHCIQFYNSNTLSSSLFRGADTWFFEGSAEWASDEVYDSIPGGYSAPTADRFRTSLDAIPPPKGGYDTVAFWKWLEAKNPGTMWSILENQRLTTQDQSFANQDIAVINLTANSYEASLSKVHPDVQFLSFFRSSLFHKDYEEDETRVDGDDEDLWGPNKLGPPRELAPGLPEAGKTIILSKGEPGDSEENPRSVDFEVVHHLTADVFVVKSAQGDNAVDGVLHVKFEPDAHGFFEVAVIAYNGTNVVEETSVAVSKIQGATATVDIDEVTEVAVITVDPHWENTGRGASQCEVWVAEESPCGELEEPILEIDNVEALQAALESPPSSGTIRLAPGNYYPQSREWDDVVDPQYDKRYANLMLNGVTLAGSTEGETRIILTHIPEDRGLGIFVQGNACVRDLTIDGSAETGNIFYVANVSEFELCNVAITDYSHLVGNDTFFYQAWDPGTFNISVHNCTFSCPNYVNDWYSGIYFNPFRWSSTGGPAPVINFELKKTEFYNLGYGVGFNNSDPEYNGTVVVDTDCYFFSNVTRKVYDLGSQTEYCP